ncbi:MAG: hypothetical protein K1X53_06515 [Candidatus Sumerlaeaceae bacterium]|nr:hypothetical protein [Candidatus Sumerlaeaceae bacterium]
MSIPVAPTTRDIVLRQKYVLLGAEVWVGDPGYSSNTGRIYVFNVYSGALLRTIENPVPGTLKFGDRIFACNGNIVASWSEKVCLLDGQTGAVVRYFSESNPSLDSTFGHDVAVEGATVYVTSFPHGHIPGNAWLYAFNSKTGALMGSVNNPNLVVESQFGLCVRAINGTVFVSDPSYKVWVPSIGRDEQIGRVYKFQGFVTSADADDTWQVYE